MIYVYCENCGGVITTIKERVDVIYQYPVEYKSITVNECYCKHCAETFRKEKKNDEWL